MASPTTVPQPTATELDLLAAMRAICDAAETHPGLLGVKRNRLDNRILGVDIATVDEMPAWLEWFGITSWALRIDEDTRYITEMADWHGWRVLLHAQERPAAVTA